MKQVSVGVYEIGFEQCQLVLREGQGAEFYLVPGKGKVPRIKLGADYEKWESLLSCVIHEAMELVMFRHGCRFDPSADLSRDHSAYMFVMAHTDFSDVCATVAEFLASALPDLSAAWEKWGKDAKKRKRKRRKK